MYHVETPSSPSQPRPHRGHKRRRRREERPAWIKWQERQNTHDARMHRKMLDVESPDVHPVLPANLSVNPPLSPEPEVLHIERIRRVHTDLMSLRSQPLRDLPKDLFGPTHTGPISVYDVQDTQRTIPIASDLRPFIRARRCSSVT